MPVVVWFLGSAAVGFFAGKWWEKRETKAALTQLAAGGRK